MPSILAFSALSVVLVIIPGPAVMLVLKSAVARGRGPALLTALGVLAADLVWAGASVAGLTALLVSSQVAFDVVRYLGAAYLVYLGIKLMLTRAAAASPEHGVTPSGAAKSRSRRRAFREGLLSDLSNPKTVIVFTSVIPQFLHHGARPADTLILGAAFAVIGFLSLAAYALVFSAAATMLRDARVTRVILRAGGAILTTFGVGLAIERPAAA
ncbi:Threonine/homoserine/homoserine lactone efflux protein [Thermomonospora echinospora]|uniref:Threonine/homoserine/homoserine lactone efflux protein n=1 Tax=Thermomonospora echinospora TaxID=1992 RepID=A0A1H6D9B5_9ACTN|nr:LysE family translocator [Thermomonospora echinospora]SEG81819.1 Threonine/homoserine/homoserine lactone efflux protein [Thermomonospora echinospora]